MESAGQRVEYEPSRCRSRTTVSRGQRIQLPVPVPVKMAALICSFWLVFSPTSCAGRFLAPEVRAEFEIPINARESLYPRATVATQLLNPRGLLWLSDASLLVSVAGTGDPDDPHSSALLRLQDRNGDGDFNDSGERSELLGRQPSSNILGVVRRDEVFGMASIAEGGGTTLVSLAFFDRPSRIFQLEGETVSEWAVVHGNVNDLAYDTRRRRWLAGSSPRRQQTR